MALNWRHDLGTGTLDNEEHYNVPVPSAYERKKRNEANIRRRSRYSGMSLNMATNYLTSFPHVVSRLRPVVSLSLYPISIPCPSLAITSISEGLSHFIVLWAVAPSTVHICISCQRVLCACVAFVVLIGYFFSWGVTPAVSSIHGFGPFSLSLSFSLHVRGACLRACVPACLRVSWSLSLCRLPPKHCGESVTVVNMFLCHLLHPLSPFS